MVPCGCLLIVLACAVVLPICCSPETHDGKIGKVSGRKYQHTCALPEVSGRVQQELREFEEYNAFNTGLPVLLLPSLWPYAEATGNTVVFFDLYTNRVNVKA